jgi:hypothetical protein
MMTNEQRQLLGIKKSGQKGRVKTTNLLPHKTSKK